MQRVLDNPSARSILSHLAKEQASAVFEQLYIPKPWAID